ncbi:MAG: subclass B1 metallo-beta-lactamase [Sediminibacterium sp.]|nr:subclass B1 metallo-beta-lactamase [Sediminibacterium sp.]
MKPILNTLLVLLHLLIIHLNGTAQKPVSFKPKVCYKSDKLIITQLTENTFEHTSFKQTQDFGNVPCNGLVVRNGNESIVFDTPTDNPGSEELIKWLNGTLHCKIKAIIPTHFHDDCLGGLKAFDEHQIPSYANFKTIELAKEAGATVPQNGFNDSLVLTLGVEKVMIRFFGEGHTKDNVVGYFPSERVLFGGCLIKELDASKGYLGDATISVWSGTVEKVKKAHPDVRIVVPGHGDYGDKALLDYTIKLFRGK